MTYDRLGPQPVDEDEQNSRVAQLLKKTIPFPHDDLLDNDGPGADNGDERDPDWGDL